jgi:hypothetical protein
MRTPQGSGKSDKRRRRRRHCHPHTTPRSMHSLARLLAWASWPSIFLASFGYPSATHPLASAALPIVFLRRRTQECERGKREWQEWHATALPQSCLSCLPPSLLSPARADTSTLSALVLWKLYCGVHTYLKRECREEQEGQHRGRGRLVSGHRQRAAGAPGALVAHFASTPLPLHHTPTIPNSHVR